MVLLKRLVGSIRRESVDHMIVLSEAHLSRILKSYARYYNGVRTHRSLNKDGGFEVFGTHTGLSCRPEAKAEVWATQAENDSAAPYRPWRSRRGRQRAGTTGAPAAFMAAFLTNGTSCWFTRTRRHA
jgi:hypothetical protein